MRGLWFPRHVSPKKLSESWQAFLGRMLGTEVGQLVLRVTHHIRWLSKSYRWWTGNNDGVRWTLSNTRHLWRLNARNGGGLLSCFGCRMDQNGEIRMERSEGETDGARVPSAWLPSRSVVDSFIPTILARGTLFPPVTTFSTFIITCHGCWISQGIAILRSEELLCLSSRFLSQDQETLSLSSYFTRSSQRFQGWTEYVIVLLLDSYFHYALLNSYRHREDQHPP